MLMLLAGGDRLAAQELWLRKVRIHLEAPQGAGASAPKAAQQVAGRRPKPAPARAQAVPKPRTAAQIARHERSQKQLRQKHLARKMWASVRIASRLLAWRCRARYNGIPASQLGLFRARIPELLEERGCPLLTSVVALVRGCPPWTLEEGGRCLKSEVLLARHTRAALPTTPTSSAATAQLPPALALVARPPATQLAPPRRRASRHPRRWPPPPGQPSTPARCRTAEGQSATRLPAPRPAPTPPPPSPPPPSRHPRSRHADEGSGLSSPPPPQQPPHRSRSPPPATTPPPSPPPTPTTSSPEARPRARLPTPNAARRSAPPPPPPPLATLPQVHAPRCL